MNILVTGGAGFIGSTYIRLARRKRPDATIVNVDALTYAGNLENLRELEGDPKHIFVRADIRDRAAMEALFREHGIDAVVNFAAESHVDRSILSAGPFLDTNVAGTLSLLEAARAAGVRRFLQISTDEVYGSLGPTGAFEETTPISPRSPYSASKAAADHFVMAFHHTHGLDVVFTRCSNNYGPYQFPEKLIPLMILNAFEGRPLPVYGDGGQVRDWIHVEDNCEAVDLVLAGGTSGEVYNIGAENERPNLDVVRAILRLTGRDESLIREVADRPGHDRRYATKARKIREQLGWRPRRQFDEGLAETVAWYRANDGWASRVRSGAYRDYYDQQYGRSG
ncbi:MAG TPA: dTDP-glucose 4,6-dehydratase [Polyangia bacterium]|jgi:dTDP-glucose 4,6-dehydratase|nr:dTDP-glucose 4,6-dehydratase [Polyangia bacterium]